MITRVPIRKTVNRSTGEWKFGVRVPRSLREAVRHDEEYDEDEKSGRGLGNFSKGTLMTIHHVPLAPNHTPGPKECSEEKKIQ